MNKCMDLANQPKRTKVGRSITMVKIQAPSIVYQQAID